MNVLLPNDGGSLGPRVIGVLGGLDLHGIPHNVSWTRLAAPALAGQSTVTLSEAVDWVAGDEILFTTTDTRIDHAERRTIASVTGGSTVVSLTSPLTYTHTVIHNAFSGNQVFHVAGAVGLLTRNVRVINRSPASEKMGFRIYVSDYATNVWNPVVNETFRTYYKGYVRLSDAQFIGFGQFVDAPAEDKREAIHLYNLGDWNISRPSYVDSCSFDTGYYSAYVSVQRFGDVGKDSKCLFVLALVYGLQMVFQSPIMWFTILSNQLLLRWEKIISFRKIWFQRFIGLDKRNHNLRNLISIMMVQSCHEMLKVSS